MRFINAKFITSCGRASQLPPCDRPEIVFCGRSNVGKSTLLNKLCGANSLARVSSTPGKTATINLFSVDGGYLVDLPGYGYAKRSKDQLRSWGELMEDYFSQGRAITLALLLLDCRREISGDDRTMLNYFRATATPFAVILTKTDKLTKAELADAAARITAEIAPYKPRGTVLFSALASDCTQSIRAELSALVGE